MPLSSSACIACRHGLPKRGRPCCPECGHVFRGAGWDGVDAHWRARHSDLVSYETFWGSLCEAHRTAQPIECPSCRKGIAVTEPRQCPECALVLKGKGWAGIESHWKARHADVVPYEEFWASLCPAHRGDDDPTGLLPFDARPARPPRRGQA
jgi:hypothetical protein